MLLSKRHFTPVRPSEVPDMATTNTRREAGASRGTRTAMPRVSDEAIRDLVQVARLLSDETRLRILFLLAQQGEIHVSDLCERLGQSQPAVSHHLALLRVSG